ncbi:plexin-B2 isoform X1 [Gallus gallus]|uniref:Plexin-B2 n=2 Tax=Gallus gallus TaxID=9031 RepID=A0A8V0X4N3_CHICK|nr:plexin-B2 isoform X1 [Gallus gallus]XP_040518398.1 plexin-B2 isoform X1 [Gallus gallus]XP_040518400.1 plexin-B2 isoform X1 [Gallus gallus]XP_040518401.1 plexin-B2 isoform X1 [Gallus gallus]XP_040518402.1 plexin-B2 isoform X1 [Gallus gallus]XP_040518403.1 plexin-B2 isoform X1 [Gallus gallus]XP_040518404.1 plexin-B2 isoform X1 [Gallus gallus]XP_040518405.1 plexin-B2 isoform X1 [Gallus gallus]XP_040518406.1 plexin-B2 isoform X1 [Gallus gallus]XP_040518407.1 plexin-B2 isoform X1 [Gallus gal
MYYVEMALWIWTLSILSCFCITFSRSEELKFFQSATELNHLTVDNDTGIIYLGVVNALYQLTENLVVRIHVETGPRKDNKKCTPPIEENQCKEAVLTDNYNKLLLLNKENKTIVVCGSLFKGICATRDLENITKVMHYVETSGEKSFVASNDENVSTVGLITSLDNDQVLFVGKGNGPNDNGIIISTRQLHEKDGKDIFEMYSDSAAVKSAYHSSSTQQFVTVFEDKNYVYFIFNQQEKQPVNNRTLIARLCKDDAHYYSYFEMDLGCKDEDGSYDHCHSAYVTTPGEELAKSMAQQRQTTDSASDDKVLIALFSKVNKDNGSLKSAMCVFSLRHINEKMEKNRDDCYTNKNTSMFYKLFAVENPCGQHGQNASKNFPCGSEHLPYLLGSKNGVIEKPVLQKEGMNLTAVTVTVENGHTVAFLGTSDGKILKVFLSSTVIEYSSLTIELNKPIKNDLVLDKTQEYLYVMTTDKVHRLPVQQCHKYSDCEKCTQAQDPYCGWCVREGRCTKRADCEMADKENDWLWSPSGTCMTIISADPQNMSRRAPAKVKLTVSPLPTLSTSDKLWCTFGETSHRAQLNEGVIICDPPDMIPPTPKGQDHVSVPLQLTFGENKIFFASHTYPFYDCEEAMNLYENQPCYSCASNRWNCQWDWKKHICEESSSAQDVIKQNMEEECPQFLNPNPSIIPMEYRTTVHFEGRHLAYYQDEKFMVGNSQFEFEASVEAADEGRFSFTTKEFSYSANETLKLKLSMRTGKVKIDSKLMVTLYNCSYGRSDCSLCLAAHEDYKCVWCEEDGKPSKCVYEKLCRAPPTNTCPHPEITRIEPKTGPLDGGILLTIMGSNLGIKAEDVKNITVADKECVFKEEFYSVSTRIVCQVGEMKVPKQGQIEVNINGKLGKSPSDVQFTYQDPHPTGIRPQSGPQAGGTTLTITGMNLATGSKKDVRVLLGSQPCNVTEFGDEIVCITGRNSKVEAVGVTMHYGGTKIVVPVHFSYSENPTVTKFKPINSFSSGGRNITVTGTGFELIQSFSLMVHAERPEAGKLSSKTFVGNCVTRLNETTVVFSSLPVLEDPENYNITTIILMDHYQLVVKNESHSFTYVADPTFENFTDGIKKQVNKLINAKGSNLNKAMTIDEAQAFVGDEPCNIKTLTETDLYCEPPEVQPQPKKRQKRDMINNLPEFIVKFGLREWVLGRVEYDTRVSDIPLNLILPLVLIPMIAIIIISIICYRRKSQQAEREYEKIKSQLEGLEESVRDRCKKEFTDLMIEMEDQTNDVNEAGIPVLDYKTYTDRVFFLPSKDGEKDVMITGKLDIPEARRQTVEQALNQFSNLLNSKSFLINFIHTLENQREFSARAKVYFASLLTVALHGKLEYYTDIMRTLFLELMEQYVVAKNPKLMLRRSETVVERMLSNWMSICLYQYLKDNAGEPLYKLFKAIKHQVEKGPVDAVLKKAKYTLNDTGLLGDDVEYTQLTVNVYVQDGGTDSTPVKVLNCDTISQVKEKIIDQVYRNLPCSQWPKAESVALEWRPGSTAQILSDLDLTSQRDGRWKRINTLMHYNVRDGATLILSKMGISQQPEDNQQDVPGERHALLEDENKVWHLVRPVDEIDESKSKRGSVKEKERTKAITEIYLTRLLSVKGTLQQFVDDFFHSVLNSNHVVPPAVKYFFDFLDEQAEKHDIKDEDTIHIWKTNSLPLRFWVNILKNPHFIFDVHVHEVVDASLSVIAQTFMDACTRTEHKLSRDSPSNKLLYAKEISNYKKMVEDYYKGIRQMVPVSDQDMNTHLAEISRAHTDSLNTLVALHQLYQYTNKYYDEIINALEEDPAAQKMQLAFRLQQIAAALENKVTDL